MKKIYNYENCTVIVNMPDDEKFQERLQKAGENFMRKVIAERKMKRDNSNTTGDFRKEEVLD